MIKYEQLWDWITDADMLLIGVGKELSKGAAKEEELKKAYQELENLVRGRNFFVITGNSDGIIYETKILPMLISAPYEKGREKQWQNYRNWLSCTLGHKLVLIELGENYAQPGLMRWPFEKITAINQKARLIRIGEKFAQIPKELGERAVSISVNSREFLNSLSEWL